MDEKEKRIYLQMELKKGSFSKDESGDFIFDVEASNENLDLEQQKVLQQALLDSKDYFLKNGVISKDHLHQSRIFEGGNAKMVFDEDYVIGEPLSVYTDGSSTRVRGKLYKNNKYAKKFIELLENGSTRVKASVGGISPIVERIQEGGTDLGRIVSVLWNDLALTIAPVNPTVAPAYVVKSLSSLEFVKALSAGYGTDSEAFTGGRTLIPEDIEGNKRGKNEDGKNILTALVEKVVDGTITDEREARAYLSGLGIEEDTAEKYIQAVLQNQENNLEDFLMSKGNYWDDVMTKMQKAFGKSKGKEDDEKKEDEKPELDDKDLIDDDEELEGVSDDDDDDKDSEEFVTKSLDATVALGEITKNIAELKEQLATLTKSFQHSREKQEVMGEGLTAAMKRVEQLSNEPLPRSAVISTRGQQPMAKGGAAAMVRHGQFTQADKETAMEVLSKAIENGEITLHEFGKIEAQINKSLQNPAFQLDQKYVRFLQEKLTK
ncbi:hypothetical protein [Treponema phagedenis]|uniref:hypothetical protein n=1 Tax=Treponema phagedenis TaxID=162 RepID=UPI0011ED6E16|nr:hypothetical protein [Treponema phagedenis]TYT77817.1 hypothetical protein FS559_01085 [Treponema phagedenis]